MKNLDGSSRQDDGVRYSLHRLDPALAGRKPALNKWLAGIVRDATTRDFDVVHRDPAALARRAAVRSSVEQDPLGREDARQMNPAARLEAAFAISRAASRMKPRT
jgi:hypothetical protein